MPDSEERVVVVSTHLDDAVMSCWSLIGGVSSATVRLPPQIERELDPDSTLSCTGGRAFSDCPGW